jgi:hypothetical protein
MEQWNNGFWPLENQYSSIPFPGPIWKLQKTYIFSVGCRNSETFNYLPELDELFGLDNSGDC